MVEVLVLVVIWRDWRPNVQIAPINRTGGGGGLQLRKVFVQRRGGEAQVSGRHYATSLNHIRSWARRKAEDLRAARTSLTRYAHHAGGFHLLIICVYLDFPVSPLQLLCHLGNIQRSITLTDGVELSLSLVPSLSVHSSARLLTWLFYDLLSLLQSSMLRYAVTFCLLAFTLAQDCQVQNIQVKENFDRHRVSSRARLWVRISLTAIHRSSWLWSGISWLEI